MRRFSYLLLAACLCVSVTGCGGDAATTTTDGPAVSEPANESGDDGSEAKEGEDSGTEETEESAEE